MPLKYGKNGLPKSFPQHHSPVSVGKKNPASDRRRERSTARRNPLRPRKPRRTRMRARRCRSPRSASIRWRRRTAPRAAPHASASAAPAPRDRADEQEQRCHHERRGRPFVHRRPDLAESRGAGQPDQQDRAQQEGARARWPRSIVATARDAKEEIEREAERESHEERDDERRQDAPRRAQRTEGRATGCNTTAPAPARNPSRAGRCSHAHGL